jgi:hypothetical protein
MVIRLTTEKTVRLNITASGMKKEAMYSPGRREPKKQSNEKN